MHVLKLVKMSHLEICFCQKLDHELQYPQQYPSKTEERIKNT